MISLIIIRSAIFGEHMHHLTRKMLSHKVLDTASRTCRPARSVQCARDHGRGGSVSRQRSQQRDQTQGHWRCARSGFSATRTFWLLSRICPCNAVHPQPPRRHVLPELRVCRRLGAFPVSKHCFPCENCYDTFYCMFFLITTG